MSSFTSRATGSENTQQRAGASAWPSVLCWVTVMLEGFDLVALGAIIPTLIKDGHMGFDKGGATLVATVSLIGVAIGAAAVGPIADRIGRRLVLIGSIFLFSVFTLVIPLAGSVEIFAVFRLIAGLGLGACMPTALTLMAEHLPESKRSHSSTLTMTGYHAGAVVASLVALAVVPNWQLLFYLGGVIGLLVVPVMWFKLPESEAFLASREKEDAARASLFQPGHRKAIVGVWIGSFMGLLLVYGLNTWLPQLMREAGYGVASSITMLFVLNAGAVAGLLLAGSIADRRGVKPTILLWFGVSAALLALLSVQMKSPWLVNLVIFITGIFVFSAMVLIYAYIAHTFAPEVRNTAIGLASAVGRLGAIVGPLVTGALVTAGIAYPWGFYFFAAVAVLGLLAIVMVPHEQVLKNTESQQEAARAQP